MNTDQVVLVEISGKGGICHYTGNLARALSAQRRVVLVTGRRYELDGRLAGFQVLELFNRFQTSPRSLVRLGALFRRPDVSVLHFQLGQRPGFLLLLCLAARRLSQAKLIVTAHNVLPHETGPGDRWIHSRIYRLADSVVVHAHASRKELLATFPVAAGKVHVVPHGNYLFFGELPVAAAAPADAAGPTVLFFGYIRQYKGLMHLIRAFPAVRARVPGARLSIVGKPVESFSVYQREIDRLGLRDCVTTNLDYVPFENVPQHFLRAQVVVLPYLGISQSGVLQLAYGFGRPVVVTRIGGLPEVVEDGGSGFVVPPGDERALAERIVALLADPQLRLRLGERARHLAGTVYSWEEIARKTVELYA